MKPLRPPRNLAGMDLLFATFGGGSWKGPKVGSVLQTVKPSINPHPPSHTPGPRYLPSGTRVDPLVA